MLSIARCSRITDKGLKTLAESFKGLTNLCKLSLDFAKYIQGSDSDILILKM